MADENSNVENNENVVEVSEQELADLGDFLAQVQIVLIGHEQRIGVLESAVFDAGAKSESGLSGQDDSGESVDGSEAAEADGADSDESEVS